MDENHSNRILCSGYSDQHLYVLFPEVGDFGAPLAERGAFHIKGKQREYFEKLKRENSTFFAKVAAEPSDPHVAETHEDYG
jgi:hypothetical protein